MKNEAIEMSANQKSSATRRERKETEVMKAKRKGLTVLACVLGCMALIGCASPREVATIGAVMGRPFGYAIGMAGVAVDETFETAGDVMDANPRYDDQSHNSCRPPAHCYASSRTSVPADDDTYYYEAKVLVKTSGPADIRSLDLQDTRDVTSFWE